jgi:hypothetical protein
MSGYAMIVCTDAGDELLMISEFETLDVWQIGVAEFRSTGAVV